MKTLSLVIIGAILVALGDSTASTPPLRPAGAPPSIQPVARASGARTDPRAANELIQEYCTRCHNAQRMRGGMSLDQFDAGRALLDAPVAEKMIRKLRAGMMPPPGSRQPPDEGLRNLAETLEHQLDSAALASPNPGARTFQRLNQPEYERSILDLLKLEIDAGAFLPPDTKSANFDNIADVQLLSPTVMDAYLTAASEISRLAVGDPQASARETTYKVPRLASQTQHEQGAPFGTRGGVSVIHNFPADGQYVFRIALHATPTGQLFGMTARDQQLEVSVDGERVALLEIDRLMSQSDPNGLNMWSDSVHVGAGPHRVSAAFLPRFEGPVEDVVGPVGHSLADTQIGLAYGVTTFPHLRDLVISGPHVVTGVSDTPIRREIFLCRPTALGEEEPCARRIVTRLGTKAYRRPLTEDDIADLMAFYERGSAEGGFEAGVRLALNAILASPHFLFRFEETVGDPGQAILPISDVALASRLSFFLWSMPPDAELLAQATAGELSDPAALEEQVRRMLADPKSEALGTRFAAQWLRLPDLEKVHPDALKYPAFDLQMSMAMRRETELFFNSLVQEDRSALELITADYTFVNERLARHYGIPGVTGAHFQRATYPDESRRGLLGQGSILTLTSHANRTSPVLRGKWVMEVLLGSPPPPPPPDVPDLNITEEAVDGRFLTVRERMERHRSDPQCSSCHRMMDPIGLALENFDVTGQWRVKDGGSPLDVSGELYDGTELNSPADLRRGLLNHPEALMRSFTENLMAYALGRRLEYFDMPTVRAITREAAANGNRMTEFVLGVVKSPAFQMKSVEAVADDGADTTTR